MAWDIGIILALQSAPGLAGVMQLLAFPGNGEMLLLFLPLLYWCVDARLGARLAVALIVSSALNSLAKIALHLPRPYWVDPRVRALSSEPSYGIPSGHAMNATASLGFLAAQLRKGWAWAAALALIAVISLSRVYLGVHFVSDVLAGWGLGALWLGAFLTLERPALAWLRRRALWQQIGLAVALSLVYLALYGGILAAIAPAPDPPAWERNAARATSAQPAIAPRNPQDGVRLAGAILGLGLAFALGARWPSGFDAHGPLIQRVLRFGVGLGGVLIVWLGLRLVSPSQPLALALVMRYVRYALLAFWVLYLAPWVFVRLGLA